MPHSGSRTMYLNLAVKDLDRSVEFIETLGPTADSREEVDALADKALASGGSPAGEPIDVDFMYKRSSHDPDGHHWEVVRMNPAVLEQSLAETGAAAS